jgi:Uma2 family endonuclease
MPPPGFIHGIVQGNILFLLQVYARQTNAGRVTPETGIITETNLDTVRGPDVAYWSFERLPADRVPELYPEVAADLCVEVLSPSNTDEKMTRKVREYLACGVRLVWVVDPDERTVTVYTKPGDGTVLWEDAVLTGGEVLPEFTCPLSEVFRGIP